MAVSSNGMDPISNGLAFDLTENLIPDSALSSPIPKDHTKKGVADNGVKAPGVVKIDDKTYKSSFLDSKDQYKEDTGWEILERRYAGKDPEIKKKFERLKQFAAQGDPHALVDLAGCYRIGLGVNLDLNHAFKLVQNAANTSPFAQWTLASYHQDDEFQFMFDKVSKDEVDKKTFILFRKAAAANFAPAQYSVYLWIRENWGLEGTDIPNDNSPKSVEHRKKLCLEFLNASANQGYTAAILDRDSKAYKNIALFPYKMNEDAAFSADVNMEAVGSSENPPDEDSSLRAPTLNVPTLKAQILKAPTPNATPQKESPQKLPAAHQSSQETIPMQTDKENDAAIIDAAKQMMNLIQASSKQKGHGKKAANGTTSPSHHTQNAESKQEKEQLAKTPTIFEKLQSLEEETQPLNQKIFELNNKLEIFRKHIQEDVGRIKEKAKQLHELQIKVEKMQIEWDKIKKPETFSKISKLSSLQHFKSSPLNFNLTDLDAYLDLPNGASPTLNSQAYHSNSNQGSGNGLGTDSGPIPMSLQSDSSSQPLQTLSLQKRLEHMLSDMQMEHQRLTKKEQGLNQALARKEKQAQELYEKLNQVNEKLNQTQKFYAGLEENLRQMSLPWSTLVQNSISNSPQVHPHSHLQLQLQPQVLPLPPLQVGPHSQLPSPPLPSVTTPAAMLFRPLKPLSTPPASHSLASQLGQKRKAPDESPLVEGSKGSNSNSAASNSTAAVRGKNTSNDSDPDVIDPPPPKYSRPNSSGNSASG